MRRDQFEVGGGTVIAYGHYGRPFLVFPSEQGRAWDFESNGMIDAVPPLIEDGRAEAVLRRLARRGVVVQQVGAAGASRAPARRLRVVDPRQRGAVDPRRLRRRTEIATVGCSLGAFHAVLFALRRADLFPLAIGMSGNYDPSTWHGWGERGDAAYFTNPFDFVPNLNGDHLDWLRSRLSVLLVVGQGQWEDTTGSLGSTQAFRGQCCTARGCAASWTCGVTTCRTTGRPGGRSSPITCPGSVEEDCRGPHRTPAGPAAGNRGGLAARVRGAGAPARAGHRRAAWSTRCAPSGSPSSRSTCARNRGTTW